MLHGTFIRYTELSGFARGQTDYIKHGIAFSYLIFHGIGLSRIASAKARI